MHKASDETVVMHDASVETITESCGNVFEDLGFENPEEELAKAKLVVALQKAIPQTNSDE